MDADEREPVEATRPLSRFRSWLSRKPRPVHPSIAAVMAQWLEYELIFNDILTRLNAQLARQAKIDRAREKREREDSGGAVAVQVTGQVDAAVIPGQATKAQLRTMMARRLYGDRIDAILAAKGTGDESHNSAGESP